MVDQAVINITLSDAHTMPMLGLGTYRLLGRECTKICQQALDVGYRHFDTAEIYGNQKEIGKAFRGFDREKLYLTSKLWLGDHTKERVGLATEKILQELDVEYLDQLLIHWPDPDVSLHETLEAMQAVKDRGLVRSLGLSNFTPRLIDEAVLTGVQVVVNQVEVHPFFQQEDLCRYCLEKGIQIVAYAPLLRGKVSDDPTLQAIGKAHGKTPSQVTLRWIIQRGIPTIPKSAHVDRIRENFDIFDFELSTEEMKQIKGIDQSKRTINPEFSMFD